MGDYGIKETKELLALVLTLGEEAHEGLKDGADLSDIPRLLTIFKEVPAAFSGIGDVPEEIMDLDNSEYEEICEYVKDEFDIAEDDVEEVVEHGFLAVTALVRLYIMIGELRKKSADQS